jgi:hypothetical protein
MCNITSIGGCTLHQSLYLWPDTYMYTCIWILNKNIYACILNIQIHIDVYIWQKPTSLPTHNPQTCACMYIICTNTYACIYINMHTCTSGRNPPFYQPIIHNHIYIYIYICILHIQIHMHVYICIYICIYVYLYQW